MAFVACCNKREKYVLATLRMPVHKIRELAASVLHIVELGGDDPSLPLFADWLEEVANLVEQHPTRELTCVPFSEAEEGAA